ncbi:hypothetical protein C2G38_2100045 [Gigaspora rosea]|uniref:Uncharacterized protein n=1 Tax=Gigaspora rosea TaxID=44941 RepID=A0A397URJ6_9GLOM|nr:hypothetical protein C2G38_2100045 [Gigaspora rosea]
MTSCAHGYSNFIISRVLDGICHIFIICWLYNNHRPNDILLQVRARCILITLLLVVIITAFGYFALEDIRNGKVGHFNCKFFESQTLRKSMF